MAARRTRAGIRRRTDRNTPDRIPGNAPGEWIFGLNPIREALAAGRRDLYELRVRRTRSDDRELAPILEAARAIGLSVSELDDSAFEVLRGSDSANSQGVALRAGRIPEMFLEELIASGSVGQRTVVALDGVEDPHNLGAILRVAEASGVHGLVLTRRRAAPLSASVARASAGAVEWVPVARVANLTRALETLKEAGFWVFGAIQDGAESVFELPDRAISGDRVVVLGGEGSGIRQGVASVLDFRVKIPMHGRVASLNVSTAAAVLLFEFQRRLGVATSL